MRMNDRNAQNAPFELDNDMFTAPEQLDSRTQRRLVKENRKLRQDLSLIHRS